jgi:subtilisin family serine protease
MRHKKIGSALLFAGAVAVIAGRAPSLSAGPARVSVLVELADPLVDERLASPLDPLPDSARPGHGAGPSPRAILDPDPTAAVAAAVERLGGRVVWRYRVVYSGVWAIVPRQALTSLRDVPGVKAIHKTRPVRVTDGTSVPFIGAPLVWNGLGNRGEGVRVAVVDTGIDYTHAAFGGPGIPGAYLENNGRVIERGTFPTSKVVAGFDFTGDHYRPSPDDPDSHIPSPDTDPLDQQGHGSHVAGTIAGLAVPGRLGAGVAPGASLHAYKVFGRGDWTPDAMVIAGVERAVDPNGDGNPADHVDVINLSLADDYGVTNDPLCVAAEHAVAAGCVVVAAAGNAGDRPYATGTPGVAESVICVGASIDGSFGGRADQLAPFSARGPRRGDTNLKPDLVAPGFGIASVRYGSGDQSRILNGTSMATPHVSGVAALVKRQHPGWTPAEIRAALTNTAAPTSTAGSAAPVSLQGAGRVRADAAVRATCVALGPDEAPSLSFGFLPVDGGRQLAREFVVRNKGALRREFRLTADFRQPALQGSGARLALDPPSIAVGPGGEARGRLLVTLDPLALRGVGGVFEVDGVLTLTEITGGEALRLPFHLIPRSVARTRAEWDAASRVARMRAEGARPSVVEVFTLASEDPVDSISDADLRAVGVRVRGTRFADRVIEFAIATHRPWTTASGDVLRLGVELDINRDLQPDYRIETHSAEVTLVNLANNRSSLSATPAEIDYNQSVARIAVRAADVGLGGDGPFLFLVTSDSLYGEPDGTRPTLFDPSRPPFSLPVSGVEFRGSATLPVAVDPSARAATPTRGLLFLYPSDAPGADQIQVLPL